MRTVGRIAYIIGATVIATFRLIYVVVRALIVGIAHVVSK